MKRVRDCKKCGMAHARDFKHCDGLRTVYVKASPEDIARYFHEEYERLAPEFGYKTRKESAVPWSEVPAQNKDLMIAVVQTLLDKNVIK